MRFPVGMLTTIARKAGKFGDYDVHGAWVSDSHCRGWYIELDGIESGSFAVCDGEIHLSGHHYFAGPEGSTFAPVSPDLAELPTSASQAIFDAIAQWEKEQL